LYRLLIKDPTQAPLRSGTRPDPTGEGICAPAASHDDAGKRRPLKLHREQRGAIFNLQSSIFNFQFRTSNLLYQLLIKNPTPLRSGTRPDPTGEGICAPAASHDDAGKRRPLKLHREQRGAIFNLQSSIFNLQLNKIFNLFTIFNLQFRKSNLLYQPLIKAPTPFPLRSGTRSYPRGERICVQIIEIIKNMSCIFCASLGLHYLCRSIFQSILQMAAV